MDALTPQSVSVLLFNICVAVFCFYVWQDGYKYHTKWTKIGLLVVVWLNILMALAQVALTVAVLTGVVE